MRFLVAAIPKATLALRGDPTRLGLTDGKPTAARSQGKCDRLLSPRRVRIIGLCFAAALVGGCSAEPLPVESPDDRAMSIVWEQTYGMERESRPVVTWHTECRTVDGTGNRATSIKAGCIVAMVHDDGAIELQAADLISDSAFALALEQWRGWLVTSSFAPVDGHAIGAAQAALRHAGL